MTFVPTGATPGIYQVCTSANTDYRIAVPAMAVGCIIWFETSASVATKISGRVVFLKDDTEITSITNTGAKLGYHPDMAVEYGLVPSGGGRVSYPNRSLHVANNTALAVVRGMWLYDFEAIYA